MKSPSLVKSVFWTVLIVAFAWLTTPATAQTPPASSPGQTKASPLYIETVTAPSPPKPEFLTAAGLVQYGFTFGIAAAAITPYSLGGKGNPSQSSVGIAAMPYFVFIPGYLTLGDVTQKYCATRALAISGIEASTVANSYATSLAKQRGSQNPGESEQEFVKGLTGWDTKKRGSCRRTLFGIYAGLPLSYEASFKVDAGGSDEGSVSRVLRTRPRGSFGVAFVPWQYVTIFAGGTRTATEIPLSATEKRYAAQWMWTVGVGGNLETIGALIKDMVK